MPNGEGAKPSGLGFAFEPSDSRQFDSLRCGQGPICGYGLAETRATCRLKTEESIAKQTRDRK
eukprot:7256280-Ditylum_brightwellii.AAC.1